MKLLRVLVLTKYGRLGASSRLRSLQYVSFLKSANLQVEVRPLVSDNLLRSRYEKGSYGSGKLLMPYLRRIKTMIARKKFDVLWIEKEALPWLPLRLELALLRGVPYVLDYDDAIFHNYDLHRSSFVRRLYGKRLDGLMANAALVTAGNRYLAKRARDANAARVEVIPTVIDLERYCVRDRNVGFADGLPRVVWIGSPATVHYLDLVREPLRAVAAKVPFVLRVIGGGAVQIPGVLVEEVKWTEESEVRSIAASDIGIMPLFDSPWERGKCGYKLIQYMACGLPVVASSVGVNAEIVQSAVGFLADTPAEWAEKLEKLLIDPKLRGEMGLAGRHRVETLYCIQKTAPVVAQLIQEAAAQGRATRTEYS